MFTSCNPENPEEKFQLYTQIIDFFKDLCCVNTQAKQVGQAEREDTSALPPWGELALTRITPQGQRWGCSFILSGLFHGWSTSA